MPQLDINTFSYQYVGIITTFCVVYIFLSYGVLPAILLQLKARSAYVGSLRNIALSVAEKDNNLLLLQSGSALTTPINSMVNTLFLVTAKFFSLLTTSLRPLLTIGAERTQVGNDKELRFFINKYTPMGTLTDFFSVYLVLLLTVFTQEPTE